LNLGIALTDLYSYQSALNEFSEAIRLVPDLALTHFHKGQTLFDLGKNQEAQIELETARRLSPEDSAVLYLLALVEMRAGNISRCADLLQQVIRLAPQDPDAQYLLGQDLLRAGKTQVAIKRWKAALTIRPDHWQALYSLGRTVQDSREAKRYQDDLRVLEKQHHITSRAQLLGQLAQDASNARNWPEAFTYFRQGLEACKQCGALPELHKNLGLAYCRTGDIRSAKRELRAALALQPGDQTVLKALQILGSIPQEVKTGVPGRASK
jgi:tetratricopeptide (TPR) repeat protein